MLAANEAVAEHLVEPGRAVSAPHPPGPGAEQAQGLRRLRPHPRLQDSARHRPLRPPAHPGAIGRQAGRLRRPLRPAPQPEAGGLQPRGGGPLRPGQRQLLPLHLADSPLSRPDRPSPAGSLAAHGRGAAATRRSWRPWASTAARPNAAPRRPSASWSRSSC